MPTTTKENLLRLMNLPLSLYAGVVKTGDGYYIARLPGDVGYNAFLGKPAPVHDGPGLTMTLKVWKSLSALEQNAVRHYAACPPEGSSIDLRDFGIPD